jgi:hypothetical protein
MIQAAGGDVVAVFQYRAAPTRNFCRQRKVGLDCYGDPEREAYREVGLDRYGLKGVLGPQLVTGAMRAVRRGAMPGIPKGDTQQSPGTFVVGADGHVSLAHYNEDSSDNPPVERVLEAVRSAGRG